MYIERKIEDYLSYVAKHFPVTVITGARQTGKTTLLNHAVVPKDANYITLDYPALRQLAANDPELFLQRYPPPVIIDEIQYAPQLFPYIKIRVDRDNTPGQYFLTGSQMFHLMRDVSESLAGRVGLLSLYPMSRAEILGTEEEPFSPARPAKIKTEETVISVFEKILRGSMPKLVADSELSAETYYSEYVQTYLERDVRDLIEVKSEEKFMRFVSCAAARTGQELNLSDLARDVDVARKTAESWLSILTTSGLVYLLKPWSGNTIRRIIKRPKLYFMDTGLACYLSLWNNAGALEASSMAGAMFETYVISEIIKSYANKGLDPRSRLSWFRDNNRKEIDLLISDNGKLYPVEIKKSGIPGRNALKNFSVLPSLKTDIGEGAVICLSPEIIPLDEKNTIVPIGCL